MSRPRIKDLVIANVIEVYVNSDEKLTTEQVTNEVKRRLGASAPSLRKVQDLLKDHKEIAALVDKQPVLSPLGAEWPKDPDDVYYLLELSRTWTSAVQPKWTQHFMDAAFEIKRVLGWPTEFPQKCTWYLPSPYGGPERVPGELAIMGEMSNRRIISESTDQQIPMDDLYYILEAKPWQRSQYNRTLRGRWSATFLRARVEGIHAVRRNAQDASASRWPG